MRIAVILTGALRTIKKTIRYLKQNVIDVNAEIDVFTCVQNDTAMTNEEWDAWFQEQLGIALRVHTWFSLNEHRDWVDHRERLLAHMQIDVSWKEYLRRSGSMIEYAQLQIASMKMTQYEHDHGAYEYVVRARTDSIFCKPIDFHWLRWTDEEINERIIAVMYEMNTSHIDRSQFVPYFMSTIVSDTLIKNIQYIQATEYRSPADACNVVKEDTIDWIELGRYIKEGRYILTFRKNNLYVVRRNLFHLIPALGTMYGQFKSPYSDPWWFNAEGQFTSVCYQAGLTTYDYNTVFEDRSVEVNGWNEADFFDEGMNCINPRMMYCVVRR